MKTKKKRKKNLENSGESEPKPQPDLPNLNPALRYAEMGMKELWENQQKLLKMIEGISRHLTASDKRDLENAQELNQMIEQLALEIGFRDWDKRDDYLKF